MRKYALDVVYKAAALDEIYKLIQDEFDLSKEDLESCKEALRDLGDPDLKFVDTNLPDNLNLTTSQEYLTERVAVLEAKLLLLSDFMDNIFNQCLKSDVPF